MKPTLLCLTLFLAVCGCAHAQNDACQVAGLTSAPTPCDKNLPNVHDMLTWNQQQRAVGFRNDYRSYPGDIFRHGQFVYPLPLAPVALTAVSYQYGGKTLTLDDYIKDQSIQGLLVISNGKIVLERYENGNNDTTLWTSRSVAKAVVSTLTGIAVRQGKIHSLDDPITRYEPDFKDTAWDGVTVKQLLQHTSGVAWDENYADPNSDFARLTRCEAEPGTYLCVYNLVHNLQRQPGALPGKVWSYSTAGAWLLGDLLEKATGKTLAAYLQDNLWIPFGMASDGIWHAYEKGQHDMGGHGFNATLRDWGRFGLFVLHQGKTASGEALLPAGWVTEATRWSRAKNAVSPGYPAGIFGYQWWNNNVPVGAKGVAPAGDGDAYESMWAEGIFGQMIAINKKQRTVMVQWATWQQAEPPADTLQLESAVFFNAVNAALSQKK